VYLYFFNKSEFREFSNYSNLSVYIYTIENLDYVPRLLDKNDFLSNLSNNNIFYCLRLNPQACISHATIRNRIFN
jgi:hypothetical protein